MIEIRSVAVLREVHEAAGKLADQYEAVSSYVWKRGRRTALVVTLDAYNDNDELVGEEVYEARFDIFPIGTSSVLRGEERWLVYMDEYTPFLAKAPSKHTKGYKRPTSKKVRKILDKWVGRLVEVDDE